jgi:hypothetical protein
MPQLEQEIQLIAESLVRAHGAGAAAKAHACADNVRAFDLPERATWWERVIAARRNIHTASRCASSVSTGTELLNSLSLKPQGASAPNRPSDGPYVSLMSVFDSVAPAKLGASLVMGASSSWTK